jgi:hypothetical protein
MTAQMFNGRRPCKSPRPPLACLTRNSSVARFLSLMLLNLLNRLFQEKKVMALPLYKFCWDSFYFCCFIFPQRFCSDFATNLRAASNIS